MPVHEIAALGAAACWAVTGILAPGPVAHLGALAFNRWRQVFAVAMFSAVVLAGGSWRQLDAGTVLPLVLSGLVGIFIGDSLLFTAVGRLGPRRAGVLFALNAPIAALLGWLVLGETLGAAAVAGISLTVAGVSLAILYGRGRASGHALEAVRGSLLVGAACGLGAATGQATGSLIARPVMAAGVDPFAASLLRVVVAAAGLTLLARLPHQGLRRGR
ncbi:DMT family transporter, partial [Amaricoccus sp.]|uniref:DMT family transporter n=1 Tax=Amaricoccus sp. TaxID=1872485 RepID=UPI0026156681